MLSFILCFNKYAHVHQARATDFMLLLLPLRTYWYTPPPRGKNATGCLVLLLWKVDGLFFFASSLLYALFARWLSVRSLRRSILHRRLKSTSGTLRWSSKTRRKNVQKSVLIIKNILSLSLIIFCLRSDQSSPSSYQDAANWNEAVNIVIALCISFQEYNFLILQILPDWSCPTISCSVIRSLCHATLLRRTIVSRRLIWPP